jgi:hypothetical protein
MELSLGIAVIPRPVSNWLSGSSEFRLSLIHYLGNETLLCRFSFLNILVVSRAR